MEWQVILALIIVIPIILVPVVFVLYLNIGGIYAAIREGVKFRVLETVSRAVRTTVIVIVPLGVYGSLVWFFFGNLGWQAALALALALPIILFVPVLIWAVVVSGLYQVARDALRRRVTAPRRRAARMAEEPVLRKVT